MTADDTTAEQRPRITSLPGDSRLVRISEASWHWVRALARDEQPEAEAAVHRVDTAGCAPDEVARRIDALLDWER